METLHLTSPVFSEGEQIPKKYTCQGENMSPPLEINGTDPLAASLVLIMEDPDVPLELRADGMFDHWVKFNIPPTTKNIEEGKEPEGSAGLTTAGTPTYVGPCPPSGEHRYFFKLFSLDTVLDLEHGTATKKDLEAAMEGHIMQTAELIGLYKKEE
jgi:Raf kinase inhibitor-like YbhB/YbcL family protein